MKYLVTGATGFIGEALCRQIKKSGHELLAFSQQGASLADGTPTRAVDFSSNQLAAQDLHEVDVVFHLAGIAHQRARPADYEQINHQAVLALALSAEQAGVSCFVYLSSVKAMGADDTGCARAEQDTHLPADAYGLSKWQAETGLGTQLGATAMKVCILRPSLVYGASARANLALLSRAVDYGLPRPPDLGGRSMIGKDDLVDLMLALPLQAPQGVSTFIATDGQVYSTRRIYDALRQARGKGVGLSWWPQWVWQLGCALLDVFRSTDESSWGKLFGTELYSNAAVLASGQWRPCRTLEDYLYSSGGRF